MKTQMSELTPSELQHVTGGGEWWGIGTLWSTGGAAFGVIAGIAAFVPVATPIVAVAFIASLAFGASGQLVLQLDSHMDAQVARATGAASN